MINKMGKTVILLILALTGCLGSTAYASPQTDTLIKSLSLGKKATVNFKEMRYFHFSKRPLISSGYFYFRAPRYLEQHYTKPSIRTMVSKDNYLVITQPGKAKRVIYLGNYPNLWVLITTVKSLLGGDATFINKYYHVSLKQSKPDWQLTLTPKKITRKGYRRIIIRGMNTKTKTIIMQQTSGDYVKITLSRVSQR
jgi:outer membrane lipoprotein-sorting protein